MTKTFQIILLILTISSCGESKKEPEKSKHEILWDKQKQLDTLNLAVAEKLSTSSNSNFWWDTTYKFTYSLQESFESDPRPISFIGEIKDITQKDSLYILKVVYTNTQSFKNFIAEISVNANIFQTLKSKLDPRKSNEGCFIFQVTKVSSHLPILKSEIESYGENVEDASSYLTLDFDESLVKLQGNLITYFIYDRVNEEDE